MVYCVSDIHGEYDRYCAMLKLIDFGDDDRMYVIGDVIDRTSGGVLILRDIMARPNMTMLLGNHEQMCLDTLGVNFHLGARQLWQSNGGGVTQRELLYRMGTAERGRILRFLQTLPDHLDIEVCGRKFHLVHAFPANDKEGRIWKRPEVDEENPFPDGRTVIIGHTPVIYLTHPDDKERDRWLDEGEKDARHMEIFHAGGYIDIDCGCGNRTATRRLACLRLDDMAEFYV